jgi:2-oxoglutarate dehydrogenase E1 component
MNRVNLEYVESLMDQYLKDPDSIDPVWQKFFEGVEFGQSGNFQLSNPQSADLDLNESSTELKVYELIQAYRDYGHLKADLDPLKLQKRKTSFLDFKSFNLQESDASKTFSMGQILGLGPKTLDEIVNKLESWYCGTLAVDFADCLPKVRDWFTKEIEKSNFELKKEQRVNILKQLARTETLEKFIHTRYVGTKRFSIEGCDSLIPSLEYLCEKGASLGVKAVTIAMAHRGRINVLANFMDKAINIIFAEFDGNMGVDQSHDYDGDVKYHLGYQSTKKTVNGDVEVSLAFNPSHLEAVNPVVLGMVRAQQRFNKDTEERSSVVPVLIHGDAAVIGQGVVAETFQLSQLKGYTTGGTIHIVMNNQVGFTTDPKDARSTTYASDIARAIKAPVLLVNGDDPEACVKAMDIAVRYRQEFKQDIMIEIVGYRRFGHNEGDEPAFTQPLMYDVIKKLPTTYAQYAEKLNKEQVFSNAQSKEFYDLKMDNLQKVLDEVRANPPEVTHPTMPGLWKTLKRGTMADAFIPVDTKAKKDVLEKVVKNITNTPDGFETNPKVTRLLETRQKQWEDDKIDWGLAELLAYGSLVVEGTSVRITGQDCIRGTFTHRHAMFFDKNTNEVFNPFKALNPEKEFCIYNSPLSEYAVLGFEYGNSIKDPSFLTVWEAQFGDFVNGAQIIIDQFLASGESKWYQMSGLVLLLPHGYEGQGPEHSSAKLERFLQLCAQYNMQVCNFTEPNQIFHALRRQVKRNFRKPMIVMSPKSLLRHPKVVCTQKDLTEGQFKEVLDDPRFANSGLNKENVKRVVMCSGKVYYDLEASDKNSDQVAIVRVEQLYPFPEQQVAEILSSYPKMTELLWTQEEPQNMGAYSYIMPKLRLCLQKLKRNEVPVYYVGRTERASPATGAPSVHAKEQQLIISQSLDMSV